MAPGGVRPQHRTVAVAPALGPGAAGTAADGRRRRPAADGPPRGPAADGPPRGPAADGAPRGPAADGPGGSEGATAARWRTLAEVVAVLPGLLARWRWDVEAVAALGLGGEHPPAGPEADGLTLLAAWYQRVCTDTTYQRPVPDAAVAALGTLEAPLPAAALVSQCRAAVRVAGELVACRGLLGGPPAEPQRLAAAVERLERVVGEALSRSAHPSSGGGVDGPRRNGRRHERS